MRIIVRIAPCIGCHGIIVANGMMAAHFGLMDGLMVKIFDLSAVCRGLLRKYT